ncbi:MAG: YhdP family protein, partial [Burkholderiaceae bacterium]|nr:YhdP family protein [Burkholderiaceae bacterium]
DFSVQWQGTYPDIAAYNLNGHFVGLSLKAQKPRPARAASGKIPAQPAIPGIPGFENLTGRVEANQQGGNVSLNADNLILHLPGYFAEPAMLFDTFKMQANWSFLPKDQFQFQIGKLDFTKQGLSGSFSGKHLMPGNREPGKAAGTIDLTGRMDGLDLKTIGRYLPLQMAEYSRKWMTGALEDGMARDIIVRLKGDLNDFPFKPATPGGKPMGEFKLSMRLENAKLNYTPGRFAKDGRSALWPQAEQINGSITVANERIEILGDTAKTENVDLQNVVATIPDLTSNDMRLDITGTASGALPDFVHYTNISPVAGWIGNFTDDTQSSGDAKLLLKFQMPLNHALDTAVQGSLQFLDDDINLFKGLPLLSHVKGKLEFSDKGFNLNGVNAHFLGGTSVVSGGTQVNKQFQVKAAGNLTTEALRQIYPTLSNRISGHTRYALTVNEKSRQPDIMLESDLRGMKLDFPEPLKKAAAEALPIKLKVSALPAAGNGLRDEIRVALGTNMSARYVRQKAAGKNAGWRLVQGGIGVNVRPPEPASGLALSVSLKSLDLDAWKTALAATGRSAKKSTSNGGLANELGFAQYIDPTRFYARADTLSLSGLRLEQAELDATLNDNGGQAHLKSAHASGQINWQDIDTNKGKVSARLTSLIVPKTALSDVSGVLTGEKGPSQLPAIDLIAENFELYGKKLGRTELVASNTPGTAGREWTISKLAISNPDANLKASGKWNTQGGNNATKMTYALHIDNAGKLLGRMGYPNVLRNGKGKIDGHLEWHGSPFAFDIPSLSGKVSLAVESGQFLKAEPGVARLLGVLSLQSLPRRLSLDFRDIFSAGFAFDSINASADITNGAAKTDNLKMRGLNATVLIEGVADVVKETQNLHVVVIPEVNASAASVVYGMAVNPVIGVGTFLAQLVLRDPLRKILTYEYQITGTWNDPSVNKIERKISETLRALRPTTDS